MNDLERRWTKLTSKRFTVIITVEAKGDTYPRAQVEFKLIWGMPPVLYQDGSSERWSVRLVGSEADFVELCRRCCTEEEENVAPILADWIQEYTSNTLVDHGEWENRLLAELRLCSPDAADDDDYVHVLIDSDEDFQ